MSNQIQPAKRSHELLHTARAVMQTAEGWVSGRRLGGLTPGRHESII